MENKEKKNKAFEIETKRKGRKQTEITKRRISNSLKGHSCYKNKERNRKISLSHKGIPLSEAHKKALIESHPDFKGKKNPFYGKHHTKEAIKKNRDAHKGKIAHNRGIPCSLEQRKQISATKQGIAISEWKDFVTFEPYSNDWGQTLKKAIRERDNYICQICNEKKFPLAVHHIDYNKKNSNSVNLISLCIKCHNKTNHNRKVWLRFFKLKMKSRGLK